MLFRHWISSNILILPFFCHCKTPRPISWFQAFAGCHQEFLAMFVQKTHHIYTAKLTIHQNYWLFLTPSSLILRAVYARIRSLAYPLWCVRLLLYAAVLRKLSALWRISQTWMFRPYLPLITKLSLCRLRLWMGSDVCLWPACDPSSSQDWIPFWSYSNMRLHMASTLSGFIALIIPNNHWDVRILTFLSSLNMMHSSVTALLVVAPFLHMCNRTRTAFSRLMALGPVDKCIFAHFNASYKTLNSFFL